MIKDGFPIQFTEPNDSYYQFIVDESVVADASSINELNEKVRAFYEAKEKRIQELESAIREIRELTSLDPGDYVVALDMCLKIYKLCESVLTEDKE